MNFKQKKIEKFGVKTNLHPRNLHREQYDFKQLCHLCPALENFVFVNEYNTETINFANPEAVKLLNKAILMQFYHIKFWDIPEKYLCPPIPSRADYIHYIADLIGKTQENNQKIKVLDIGVGANCIYPIIGSQSYGWQFVGSDIDPLAIQSAKNIISANSVLNNKIECRLQSSKKHIFEGIIQKNENFDVSICNPPFHASAEEAMLGTQRKIRNLTKNKIASKKLILNFGGQNTELWCEGGEETFIKQMIIESTTFATQVGWFTSLVSKKEHLANLYKTLKNVKATDIRTIEMSQGQKISRILAWTFQTF